MTTKRSRMAGFGDWGRIGGIEIARKDEVGRLEIDEGLAMAQIL